MIFSVRLLGAVALTSLAMIGCAPTSARSADNQAEAKPAAAATVALDIRTAKGVVHYKVEVATTGEEQARGLMYRTSLPDHGGMIFPMMPPRFAAFWMKNTYISLDLIFIRPDGTIARIAANAVPEKLDPIESGEPVSAVLEIIGGGAVANGIAVGDKVTWKKP
ncbi:MAG: DUF192 domain-containing protein [Sphingomonadales bacterium]|nr:MAG: DUF192 domain-containing protein [Sphingomonadales bacterium]